MKAIAEAHAPALHVSPRDALVGEGWRIRATGLKPGARAELLALHTDDFGIEWRASAVFEADGQGIVDPAAQAPLSGTYSGVDASGLFWSTRPVSGKPPSAFPKSIEPRGITVRLDVDGNTLASEMLHRMSVRPGVERHPVDEAGLVGTLFTPVEQGRRPAIIVLSGSEGGVHEPAAAEYAGHGYTTLALAFFGVEGLPDALVNVPLETVERAISWLQAHPRVRPDAIGVWGASKGAELALLAASHFPEIRAVVAKSPSAVAFEGTSAEMGRDHISSWSYGGRPVPFVPITFTARIWLSWTWARLRRKPWSTSGMYAHALEDREAVERAAIEVERIRGPILLTSSDQDGAWPSGRMARMIMDRLRDRGHPFEDVHLHYEGAGHQIAAPFTPTTVDWLVVAGGMIEHLGGTPEANAAASADSWPKINEFMRSHLAA